MSDYGPTPTSNATINGTTTDIPIGAVVPDGTTTPVATAGGPSYVDTGKTKAPASVYIKDGNNATQGTTTDTAVVGDNPGTLSAKLRGLTKIFNDIWDSVNHRFNVAVQNGNVNGSNTSANAQPVTIATDQLPLSGVQADATANPTVSQISVFPMGFNGTTWDRLKSDNTGARRVSLYGKQTAAGDTPVLVDASGRVYVNVNSLPALPAGSNLIGGAYLVDSAGTNKAAVDASGRQSVKAAAGDFVDLATIVTDVTPFVTSGGGGYVRQDSTATIAKESGGNLATIVTNTNKLIAPSVNSGTIDATTQRTVAGGAATGTKTNVASSATSVALLSSNTARKGATLYNDSTQIAYVDLTGGTASSSSYSVQMPANGFFELPGPNIYNGAISAIWASANGNMRITEFS